MNGVAWMHRLLNVGLESQPVQVVPEEVEATQSFDAGVLYVECIKRQRFLGPARSRSEAAVRDPSPHQAPS